MHLDDIGSRPDAVLHHKPRRVLVQVASLVLDRVGMVQLPQEANLLQDILPLFHALFAHVGHLLDRDNLAREIAFCVVDRTERSMANFAQIFEYLLRVMLIEQLGYLGILQASRPHYRHTTVGSSTAAAGKQEDTDTILHTF